MKFRQGFVSNSSNSSFICVKCGDIEGGFDVCIEDCEMIECENGHEIHFDCIENYDEEKMKNVDDDDGDKLKSEFCPACKMEVIADDLVLNFCMMKLDASRKAIEMEMREKYKTFDKMIKACKKKK